MAGDVRVTITGDDRTAAAFRSVDSHMKRLESTFRRVRNVVGTVISVAAIRQITSFVRSQVAAVDAIGEVADAAGLGAEEMQRYQRAFGLLTQATEGQVNQALQNFNKRLGEARAGSETLQKSFAELGVDLRADTGPALQQTFQGLARVNDGARRAALAGDVLGDRVGPKLAGAIQGTTKALDDAKAAATGIFTDEQVERASKLDETFTNIAKQINKETSAAILDHSDAWETLAVALGKVAGKATAALGALIELAKQTPAVGPLGVFMAGVREREGDNRDMSQGKLADVFEGPRTGTPPPSSVTVVNPADVKAKAEAEAKAKRDAQKLVNDLEAFRVSMIGTIRDINEGLETGSNAVTEKEEEAARIIESTRTEMEQLEAQIARVQELTAEGWIKHWQGAEITERLAAQLDALAAKTDAVSQEISTAIETNIGSAVEEMFARGSLEADDFFAAVLRDIARVIIQLKVIKPLMEGLFGASAGGKGSGFLGALGSAVAGLFGGGKPGAKAPPSSRLKFAKGADFMVGGSGGPDSQYFPMHLSPRERVTITPAGSKAGGSTISIVQNIDARGAADPSAITMAAMAAKESAKAEIIAMINRRQL